MAGDGPQDLHELAEELLAAVVESLDTIPSFTSLEGAPDRAYVSPGEPAADCCPQVTVHTTLIDEAPTEPAGLPIERRAGHHLRLNHVGLIVTIFRCVPSGEVSLDGTFTPPDMVELEAAAEQLHADAWAIWHHLFNMVGAGTLLPSCGGVIFEGARAIPPSGGCAGWIFAFRVRHDGYEEVIP